MRALMYRAAVVAAVAVVPLGLAAGVASAPRAVAGTRPAVSGSNPGEQVSTGILAPEIPGALAFGTTPDSTPEQVSFILKERNVSALESAVAGGLERFDSVS